jgi:hypothetical protein
MGLRGNKFMSDSHYWTSLWAIFLFIFLAICCFAVVIAAGNYLYDRLHVLPFWNSSLWLRYKIPIIVIGFILCLAALIAFIRHQGQREVQIAQEYAEKQGWEFSQTASPDFSARVKEIVNELDIDMYYVRTVETRNRKIWIFNCTYRDKEASSRKSYSYGTACLIESHRFQSTEMPVSIELRDWTEVMTSDKVDMGKTPFGEKFLVLSKDAEVAHRLVNEVIQSVMLQYFADEDSGRLSVTLGNRGAVLLTSRITDQDQLQDLLKWACMIEEAAK